MPDEKVAGVIEKTIEWYLANGIRGERIAKTVRRVESKKYLEFMRPVFGDTALTGE